MDTSINWIICSWIAIINTTRMQTQRGWKSHLQGGREIRECPRFRCIIPRPEGISWRRSQIAARVQNDFEPEAAGPLCSGWKSTRENPLWPGGFHRISSLPQERWERLRWRKRIPDPVKIPYLSGTDSAWDGWKSHRDSYCWAATVIRCRAKLGN